MPAKAKIGDLLEKAYLRFHSKFQRERDPISLVHTYSNPKDQEVAALLVALLSYGNVATILQSCRRVLVPLGDSPYRFLKASGPFHSPGFKHRFTTETDLQILCAWISAALKTHESIENFFLDQPKGNSFKNRISTFVQRFKSQPLPDELSKQAQGRRRNLDFLLSNPDDGSACKRLNMYLRWMIRRSDGIDLGLWEACPSELYLPVDTHILSVLKTLRWTRSSSATWRVVEQATTHLRGFRPEDPIRYDFALCHLSMEGYSLATLE